MKELQGSHKATGRRFALVVSTFNKDITDGLLRGARSALTDAGVNSADITLVRVPGAFEIPLTARRLARSGRYDAVDLPGVCHQGRDDAFRVHRVRGLARDHGRQRGHRVPVTFGVLTTLTEEQAVARAGDGPDNKGREAALAAVEMATLVQAIGDGARHDG